MNRSWTSIFFISVFAIACDKPARQEPPPPRTFQLPDLSAPVPAQPPEYREEVRAGRRYRIYNDGRTLVYLDGGEVDSLYGPVGWMEYQEYQKRLSIRARLDCQKQRFTEITIYGRPQTVCAQ
jgi:hypothetical protein